MLKTALSPELERTKLPLKPESYTAGYTDRRAQRYGSDKILNSPSKPKQNQSIRDRRDQLNKKFAAASEMLKEALSRNTVELARLARGRAPVQKLMEIEKRDMPLVDINSLAAKGVLGRRSVPLNNELIARFPNSATAKKMVQPYTEPPAHQWNGKQIDDLMLRRRGDMQQTGEAAKYLEKKKIDEVLRADRARRAPPPLPRGYVPPVVIPEPHATPPFIPPPAPSPLGRGPAREWIQAGNWPKTTASPAEFDMAQRKYDELAKLQKTVAKAKRSGG